MSKNLKPYTTIKAPPLQGGVVTERPASILPYGSLSVMKNVRNQHPGMRTRKGCKRLNTLVVGTYQVTSINQFRKTHVDEQHIFAQMSNNNVLEAASDPPAVTAGVFGPTVFFGSADQIPASWANIGDKLLMSNGVDQHQIYGGDSSRIESFIVLEDSAAVATIPVDGRDYSIEVSDGQSDTAAILDDLPPGTSFGYVFIKSPTPMKSFTPTMKVVNGGAATVMTVWYRKSDNTWSPVSNLTDGTSDGGVSLAQTGTVTFTEPTDMIPKYQYGQSGFWYGITFSVVLGASVEISDVTFDSNFQSIVNVWDGLQTAAVEVQTEGTSTYSVFGGLAVDLSLLESGKKIMISCADPIEGLYIDPGATPNATGTTITSLKYWNGTAFVTVGTVTDDTAGLSSPGWITFPRQAAVQPRQFGSSQYYAYWYELILDAAVSDDTSVAVQYMPYFDINELGRSQSVEVWKDRAVYSFDRFGSYLYVSKTGFPLVLNGPDFGILQAGDGRSNKVVAQRKFHNELMVWQEEKGTAGGCLTLFEGYSPTTFGKLLLSSKIGCMNSKCATVVDGVLTATSTDETVKTLAFFLSRYGVCVCDGRTVNIISDDINNYFDPQEPECIRYNYEQEMWLEHDVMDNVIRVGLVSGDTATTPNVFPVYDIESRTWGFDTPEQKLSCLVNVESGSTGNDPIIQIAGGLDGFVYQVNVGLNDVGTAIDSDMIIELNADGEKLNLLEMSIRAKARNDNTITVTAYENGTEKWTKPLSLAHQSVNQQVVDHLFNTNVQGKQISIRLQQNAKDESMYLYGIGLRTSIWKRT